MSSTTDPSATATATATGTTSTSPATSDTPTTASPQQFTGISLEAFLTALATSLVIFGIQLALFLLLRNKLARIFKPKTYLVPERERTDPPPVSPWGLVSALMRFKDREIIKKCGLDAYFFLRYLQSMLVIFVPIALVVIPVLVPINYVGGLGQDINANATGSLVPTGLDTLAWGNLAPVHQNRRWAHLVLAVMVILWVWFVLFSELRIYIKVRQDWLTSAEHRLRASANTVLVSSIPDKWLSVEALRGLFDVFPGGIRNIWLTRDFTKLLDKIHKREEVHQQLEEAESDLIRECKRRQLEARAKLENKERRANQERALSKSERIEKEKVEDEEARRRAEAGGGISAGDHEEMPVDAHQAAETIGRAEHENGIAAKLGGGLKNGLRKGVAVVGSAGRGAGNGILGGAKVVRRGVDGELDRSGGFDFIKDSVPQSPSGSDRHARRVQIVEGGDDDGGVERAEDRANVSVASDAPMNANQSRHAHSNSVVSQDSQGHNVPPDPRTFGGNTVRKMTNMENMYVAEDTKWYQFWKPPTGAYASPVPQGAEGDEYPWKTARSFWRNIRAQIPFLGGDEEPVGYAKAFGRDYDQEKEESAQWQKWLKPKDRPHHRLALFDWTPGWLPGLPLIHKKVDTIYWCRAELAQLNLEIEEDQRHPERYPVMNSAFIQFNHQVAAHMACQSVTHHVPKNMAPRVVEISPDDVIWDNMAIKWWDEALRYSAVFLLVAAMIILWAIPVAWTASLAQVDALLKRFKWLDFLQANDRVFRTVKAVAYVLPAIFLAILLALVPIIMSFLAGVQGAKTGSQRSEFVQTYYFVFLFVQVFLVVSVTSGTLAAIATFANEPAQIPDTLARSLPKAANYFFSYMILQALSTSSGTLLQVGTLFMWYILARVLDNTARSKWRRNTELPSVTWGSYFPVYTNFACIALIYSIIAPIISIFAVITFSLLWFANRYQMLYVTRFKTDTGGVLYPRAINQTFTGIYVMELCLIGLFFLARDETDKNVGFPMGVIMIIMLVSTIAYQYLLNSAFGPLLRYLPITFEDEAVLRDEAFQRAQDRRLGLATDEDEATSLTKAESSREAEVDVEKHNLSRKGRTGTGGAFKMGNLNPVKGIVHAGTWAARGGKQLRAVTIGKAEDNLRQATTYRRMRRQKDLEAQRAIGEALYGGYHDEIEDLTPEERDALVRKAFQHDALRARRPTVWIPRDDIGVSDDEIRRTTDFSEYIWISNEGTALDSKVRVVYGRNPPDFADVDLITL